MEITLKTPAAYGNLPIWQATVNGRTVEFMADGNDDLPVIAAKRLGLAYVQPSRLSAHLDGTGPKLGERLVIRESFGHSLPTTDRRAFHDGVHIVVESFLVDGRSGQFVQMVCRTRSGKHINLSDPFNWERVS